MYESVDFEIDMGDNGQVYPNPANFNLDQRNGENISGPVTFYYYYFLSPDHEDYSEVRSEELMETVG